MALTKVKGSGVEGITNLSNATFLSVDASEVATLLTSAVVNSGGGAVTHNIAEGLASFLVNYNANGQDVEGSLNQSSLADNSTGNFTSTFTSNFNSASDKFFFGSVWNTANDGSSVATNERLPGITQTGDHANSASTLDFDTRVGSNDSANALVNEFSGTYVLIHGDLA